jgi:hypothetical protein
MSTMQDLISAVLVEINDPSQITYQNAELLRYLNYGIRTIRRTVLEIRPRLLCETPITGTYTQEDIIFPRNIMRVIEFKFNHRLLQEFSTEGTHRWGDNIDEWAGFNHSERRGFMFINSNTLRITPCGEGDSGLPYIIDWVAAVDTSLTLTDDSGIAPEWEDMVIEFASARAGIRNGADMSGENSYMTMFRNQIEENIAGMGGPRHSFVRPNLQGYTRTRWYR